MLLNFRLSKKQKAIYLLLHNTAKKEIYLLI